MDAMSETWSSTGDDVEIYAPDVNVDEIMATIRRSMQRRQAEGLYQATHFPEFEEVTCPEEPPGNEHNPLLYFLLRELNQTHAPRFQIDPTLTPSRLDNLPVVSTLWNSLRRQLHGLSFFYANKVAGQMIGYNRYLVTILNLMTRHDQRRKAEMAELKQRLAKVEAQLAQLEQKG